LLYNNNEQIFSISADAGKALQNLEGRYSKDRNPDDNLYVKGRSGDHHTINRVGRPSIRLNEPCIALFWLTQPAKVTRMLSNEDLSTGGFLPRCLIFDTRAEPTEIPEIDTPIPHAVRETYGELLKSFLDAYRDSSKPVNVPSSTEATKVIRDFHNRLIVRRKTDLRDISSFVARWHENAWGIALVLHAALHGTLAHTKPICEQIALNAVELMEWFGKEQIRVLSNMRYECDLNKVELLINLILDRYNGQATLRDLQLRNSWKQEEVQRIAARFETRLSLEPKSGSEKGGRPSPTVRVL
jgi:Protein of unknown function (DUF3987)